MTVTIASLIGGVLLLIHLVGLGIVSRRMVRRKNPDTSHFTGLRVTLIRPVCGIENHLEETLRSTFQTAVLDCEIIFCVADPQDPAIPVVRRLMAEHPTVDARLLIGNESVSTNPKLNNMVKGWRAARHDWIVMADSNVLLPVDCLHRLLAEWRPDVGLVCSPPVGSRPEGLWAGLECAFLNTYQARWQCLADALGYGFAQGKVMLWRRDILDDAGGLAALGTEPAEDAAATKIVRKAGFNVRLVDVPFEQPLGRRGFLEVWNRQLRWARLRRDTFPWLYSLEVLTGIVPVLIAMAILIVAFEFPISASLIGLAVAWYGAEAILAALAGWHLTRWSPLAWALRDLLIPAVWVASWLGNEFVWRGNAMTITDRARSA